ncbi:hypothetical protein EVAR_32115_1 [Eumeta japonica]|uniref:Uncharacterized protein n=1 Tax=Eumeta variegata TaxID=151549 RepID=A0A4C1V5U0_EUMVA|nr:hypothetical protein EVAR_32115_1 [Eumeta japonica]
MDDYSKLMHLWALLCSPAGGAGAARPRVSAVPLPAQNDELPHLFSHLISFPRRKLAFLYRSVIGFPERWAITHLGVSQPRLQFDISEASKLFDNNYGAVFAKFRQ